MIVGWRQLTIRQCVRIIGNSRWRVVPFRFPIEPCRVFDSDGRIVKLLRSLAALTEETRHGAITIGNFDGVHRGHARIVERLIEHARRVGGPAVVFTFDPHPVRLLRPNEAPPPLTWTDRKAELLGELGVDAVVAYPTDEALLQLSAGEFFENVVTDALAARAIVEGPNFCFGRGREGDIERLRELSEASEIELEVVPPLEIAEHLVSSSRVRNEIADGNVAAARSMMTRPYRVRGMVTHGAGRGAKIGFPTANVEAIDTLVPADGVYAGIAHVNGQQCAAAINVGPNPTFGENARKTEVHLIGWDESVYGASIEVDFLERLRGVVTFGSVDELIPQIRDDVERAREVWQTWLTES